MYGKDKMQPVKKENYFLLCVEDSNRFSTAPQKGASLLLHFRFEDIRCHLTQSLTQNICMEAIYVASAHLEKWGLKGFWYFVHKSLFICQVRRIFLRTEFAVFLFVREKNVPHYHRLRIPSSEPRILCHCLSGRASTYFQGKIQCRYTWMLCT